jgi:hypothetical protein
MSLERLGRRSSDSSERHVIHELLLEPRDHTHQVTSRCAIASARAKYGNDLILVDFNLVLAGRSTKPPNLIPCQIFWLYDTRFNYLNIPNGKFKYFISFH